MLPHPFKNAFVKSKRRKKIATRQSRSSKHAFSLNSTPIVPCGCVPSGFSRSWTVCLAWQSRLPRSENRHADPSLWRTSDSLIEFKELRHPTLCLNTNLKSFIPNDVSMGGDVGKVILLTGVFSSYLRNDQNLMHFVQDPIWRKCFLLYKVLSINAS
jgi:hypothetical protein